MDAGALLDLLGNENRRRILQLLSRKPCYVTEISEHLGVSPKAVIDHLRKLEESGLIESHTDDQRRKYFHISENLRLEVTVGPHRVGMKSAYPASPSLDISSCQHLSLEMTRQLRPADANPGQSIAGVDPGEIASLATELDELQDLERELSLAQRWVQGRIVDVLDRLAESADTEEYVDAEILAALAGGTDGIEAISREVEVPPPVVEERLRRLEELGAVRRRSGEWGLAES